ncbi:CHAT domain-containing protein [Pyxidicoccus fallax]|uniref:CHAT domain-containing protein n=1 Tax=Pyxidicoccus fallax TaxID=394095 RepID=A0A848L9X1_9BACT|nr:CHAT domain-containing protein [Pyxidicoccus fallax]NMO15052.1 CHAT domain-containing protein [Pyxidicoccus fallax]NPC78260.1 CHAT domain-containing protein [Pyxidicoccus fallax]
MRLRAWYLLPLLALGGFLLPGSSPPAEDRGTSRIWLTTTHMRPIEPRLSVAPADVHRPYVPMRGVEQATPVPLRELARLEALGDRAGVAASYLVHGDPQQALAHLSLAPASPHRESDRAAAAFLLGRHDEALTLLDGALDVSPRHPQALWNRALVLRELGLNLLAASAFEDVAELGEPGWSTEAQEHARTLRASERQRADAWMKTRDAVLALVGDPAAPIPLDEARRLPGTARAHFYDAVRTAPTAARVRALLPLAELLDRAFGGVPVLVNLTRRAAARDFSRRGPLALEYTKLVRRAHPTPAAFVQKLRGSGETDLLLGALLLRTDVPREPAEVEALARATEDPWLAVLAQEEVARMEDVAGKSWQSTQRLRDALRFCREQELGLRCLDLQRRMSQYATSANRLAEAEELARASWREARRLGEWGQEGFSIRALGQAARYQYRVAPAKAYLDEFLERSPGDCDARNYVHRNLASLAMMRLRPAEARLALDRAQECTPSVALIGAWTLADLWRVDPRPSDEEVLRRELALVHPDRDPPGRRVLATLIAGRFTSVRDREKGKVLLRQAIAEAEPLLRTHADARDARAVAYQTLAVSAGSAGAFEEVPQVVAEQLGVTAPERCVLAAALDQERTVVVARGPNGEVRGHHDASRREPLGEDLSSLVPRELVALLRSCEQVDVLAAPPLDSRSGLLPPEMAWRYRVGTASSRAPSPTRDPLHVVVANVETPGTLRLARLSSWESAPAPAGHALELTGMYATPSRVLEAMTRATDIEFHAHGLVDRSLSEATVIALAPEHDGRYALTAEEIRQTRLEGAPVVLLGACSAARLPPLLHQTSSLPQAFVDAGARAVLAATVDIPDSAGRFFQAVRERIHTGTRPALALRQERLRWLREEPGARWVTRVLLYE